MSPYWTDWLVITGVYLAGYAVTLWRCRRDLRRKDALIDELEKDRKSSRAQGQDLPRSPCQSDRTNNNERKPTKEEIEERMTRLRADREPTEGIMTTEQLSTAFGRLLNDEERWRFVIKHAPRISMLLDNDAAVIWVDYSEKRYKFDGYLGWNDCAVALGEALGLKSCETV